MLLKAPSLGAFFFWIKAMNSCFNSPIFALEFNRPRG